jgi:hypothetical protein
VVSVTDPYGRMLGFLDRDSIKGEEIFDELSYCQL